MSPASAARAPVLIIPALGVHAPVTQVGVVNGAQAVTPSTTHVFHWRYGVKPGRRGSAVLAGHTCHFTCTHAVFNGLGHLHKGNRVRYRSGGKTVTFRVTRVQRHAHPSAKQVRSWYSRSGHARLVLVTCGDPGTNGEYRSRVVVFARRVN